MEFLLLISFYSFSCDHKNKHITELPECNSKIDSITALYYNYSFNSVKAVKCSDIKAPFIPDFRYNSDGVYDAKINDCKILLEIEKEVESLISDTLEYKLDTRIAINVFYRNGSLLKICMNDKAPNDIYVDGIKKIASNRLLFLLKNNIGYYSWFEHPEDYETELKDTSYAKEPIIISPYYKQYINTKIN